MRASSRPILSEVRIAERHEWNSRWRKSKKRLIVTMDEHDDKVTALLQTPLYSRHRDLGAAVRAVGSLVLSEPTIGRATRLAGFEERSSLEKIQVPEPEWLSRYR